tara:strand:- start:163 stop:411 length:249 start_codon:yes stop_codon:yes gene_type:complete
MDKKKLKEVAGELENASKMHAGQAKKIKSMLKYKKSTPFTMKGYTYPGASPIMKKGPCWEGYEMIGMKKKGGRSVPNCVPKK